MLVIDYLLRAIITCIVVTRHPEKSCRPPFGTLVFQLSQPDSQLIQDTSTVLGGPLETGHDLYPELQEAYLYI